MKDSLLLEIGTEELPSWYIEKGSLDLGYGVEKGLNRIHVNSGPVHNYGSPRRISVLVEGVSLTTEVREERRRGPAEAASFDAKGLPTKAALGFARANSVEVEHLTVEETERGAYLFAVKEVGGDSTINLLPSVLTNVISELPAPRKMKWGSGQTSFIRPIKWITALLGGQVIDFAVGGVNAGNVTYGHRFLSPGEIVISDPSRYVKALTGAQVLVDIEQRREATKRQLKNLIGKRDLQLTVSPELLDEVVNLVEKPFGVLGEYDHSHLELPEDVLRTVMMKHQRFFPFSEPNGKVAPFFAAISNNLVKDTDIVRKGYQQVLNGRLQDARYFWDADRKVPLLEHAQGLSGILFHRQLGTIADKVNRIRRATISVSEVLGLSVAEKRQLEAVLPVYRSDLSTEMVAEHPDLEGTMAKEYALVEGFEEDIAEILEEGVLPKGPMSRLPTNNVSALLAVMDRLDTLTGFFSIGLAPTGSADPYGLRRAAVGVVRVLNTHGWEVPLRDLIGWAAASLESVVRKEEKEIVAGVNRFLQERLVSVLQDYGIKPSIARAAVDEGSPVIHNSRRALLLSLLFSTKEFPDVLSLFKRASNLIGKSNFDGSIDPALIKDPAELHLFEALDGFRDATRVLIEKANEALMPWDLQEEPPDLPQELSREISGIIGIKRPLDHFLENLLVLVDDEDIRRNRLSLLNEVKKTLSCLGNLEDLEGIGNKPS